MPVLCMEYITWNSNVSCIAWNASVSCTYSIYGTYLINVPSLHVTYRFQESCMDQQFLRYCCWNFHAWKSMALATWNVLKHTRFRCSISSRVSIAAVWVCQMGKLLAIKLFSKLFFCSREAEPLTDVLTQLHYYSSEREREQSAKNWLQYMLLCLARTRVRDNVWHTYWLCLLEGGV